VDSQAVSTIETDLANQSYVYVTFPGGLHNVEITSVRSIFDLSGDGSGHVDMRDVAIVARAFGSTPGSPNWNPLADITGPNGVPDGKVDMRDVALVAKHFGEPK
jgi:hypothetical protein